jgi:serine/threonine-protein kinase
VASLVSVAATAVGWAIAQKIRTVPIDRPAILLAWFLPQVICAFLAYIPAGVVHRLGRDIHRARRLGSYELVERLGEGGMGEVWRAKHRLLARPAAIKLIKHSRDDAQVRARFEREAQTTALLSSPHTVSLYDFGVSEAGGFYYVMELLRGIDLERLVARYGPLPAGRVVHILLQVCDSLEEAHDRGLVHRDIKPANIYLARQGQHYDFVKVLDFGLVKTGSAADVLATAEGSILGTPAYLAPEIATGDRDPDRRVDIYALGCVAYRLITGMLVFDDADTPMKAAIAHATQAPRPLAEVAPGVPPALADAVMACLAKQPDARPGSAAELAARLEALRAEHPWTQLDAHRWWEDRMPDLMAEPLVVSESEHPTAYLRRAESTTDRA